MPLLDQIPDLSNAVISADMMHTQREHARYLHQGGAYFVLPVGGNQPGLFDQLDALDWRRTPISWITHDRGPRTAGDPHHPSPPCPDRDQVSPRQTGLTDRTPRPRSGRETLSAQAVLGVTSLSARQADPMRLTHPRRVVDREP